MSANARARLLRGLGWLAVALAALAIGVAPTIIEGLRSAGVLMAVMEQPRPALLGGLEHPVTRTQETLPLSVGPTRAFRYRPTDRDASPPLVLLHGVHPDGIDEKRLAAFATAMAGAGLDVLTPALPELARFEVTEATLPRIMQSVRHHAARTGQQTAGVIGISFAGGLSLIAAGRAEAPPWARFVVAVGAHHDLRRLARYYAGRDIEGPDGRVHAGAAHPYGARVIIHAHAEHFFPPADVPIARELLGRWLGGDMRAARQQVGRLSPDGRAAMAEALDYRNRAPLGGPMLRAVAEEDGPLDAASPVGKLADVDIPVFVVHGEADPIIPSSESRWLARELAGKPDVRVLITPVLRHAEMSEPPGLADYADIVGFMAAILRAAGPRSSF